MMLFIISCLRDWILFPQWLPFWTSDKPESARGPLPFLATGDDGPGGETNSCRPEGALLPGEIHSRSRHGDGFPRGLEGAAPLR